MPIPKRERGMRPPPPQSPFLFVTFYFLKNKYEKNSSPSNDRSHTLFVFFWVYNQIHLLKKKIEKKKTTSLSANLVS